MRQSDDRKVQFAAAGEVLSRGYGPPQEVAENGGSHIQEGNVTFNFMKINEAEVMAFLDAVEKRGDRAKVEALVLKRFGLPAPVFHCHFTAPIDLDESDPSDPEEGACSCPSLPS
jgi:hypothetical protein